MTVLVTGVGAPVGVSIVKALRQSELRPRIVATDADLMSVGLFRAEAAYLMPHAADDERGYLRRLEEICHKERVAMVCFGSEIEMRRMAPHRAAIERETGARLVLNEPSILGLFMDKWAMIGAFRERGFPVPDSVLATDPAGVDAFLARHDLPVILKPRNGSGSKNVHVVRTRRQLELLIELVPEALLQEQLLPDAEEYTVGLYQSPSSGYLGQIVLRRELSAGLTYKAEVVRDQQIEEACRQMAQSFEIWGPINFQLRKTAAGVRVFEINLRFSSSVVMRAYFGFNEPELALRDLVLHDVPTSPVIRPGYAFRYWDEIYLAPGEYQGGESALDRGGPIGRRIDAL
jgi:carbamoyl-phosphate synthase large subunit